MAGNAPQLVNDVNSQTFTESCVQLKCPGNVLQGGRYVKPGRRKDSQSVSQLLRQSGKNWKAASGQAEEMENVLGLRQSVPENCSNMTS